MNAPYDAEIASISGTDCNLCSAPSRASVRLIAQNNKRADQFPLVQNQCAKQRRRSKGHSKGSQRRRWLSRLVAGW